MAPSRSRLPLVVVLSLGLVVETGLAGRIGQPGPATPVEPIEAIIEAFRTHDLVALSDAHGNVQAEGFLRALVGSPRFPDVVNDIVVEFANARYQDLVDRYVRGERVPLDAVRPAWQDTTVPNQIWADQALFEAVRAINASRPSGRRLRIVLGDPPIDWGAVRTRDDHSRWLAMRDSYPAALVQVEVLAKHRKALIVYGHLHFQRRQIMSNFDMSDWRAQTIVSLIEGASPSRVFTIWRVGDELAAIEPDVVSWKRPSLAVVRDTRLGAADIATVSPGRGRTLFRGGAMVPVPKDEWRPLRIEEQLDAVLYLGPTAEMTEVQVPPTACTAPGFLAERLRRIALTGVPAFEAERVRQVCAGAKVSG